MTGDPLPAWRPDLGLLALGAGLGLAVGVASMVTLLLPALAAMAWLGIMGGLTLVALVTGLYAAARREPWAWRPQLTLASALLLGAVVFVGSAHLGQQWLRLADQRLMADCQPVIDTLETEFAERGAYPEAAAPGLPDRVEYLSRAGAFRLTFNDRRPAMFFQDWRVYDSERGTWEWVPD